MFKALGNPIRFEMLKFLVTHPGCITGDIVDYLPIAQATVSQHLKVLRDAGLVQGEVSGNIRINGPLIIWTGGAVRGRVRVTGDLYLFGRLGAAGVDAHDTSLECQGMAYVSKTGVSTGTLMARRLQLYEGADLQGPFKTLKLGDKLPVLNDVHLDSP